MVDKRPSDVKEIIQTWAKVYDKARYLKSEHDLKEKEYGIPWRSAYKALIIQIVYDLEKNKLVNERAQTSEQAFDIIIRVASYVINELEKKDKAQDVAAKLNTQYNILEKNVIYLKKLLKEPEPSKFDEIKKKVFA